MHRILQSLLHLDSDSSICVSPSFDDCDHGCIFFYCFYYFFLLFGILVFECRLSYLVAIDVAFLCFRNDNNCGYLA